MVEASEAEHVEDQLCTQGAPRPHRLPPLGMKAKRTQSLLCAGLGRQGSDRWETSVRKGKELVQARSESLITGGAQKHMEATAAPLGSVFWGKIQFPFL